MSEPKSTLSNSLWGIHLTRFCSSPRYCKDSAATPIDQALDKAYNKLAKALGEVIGVTQKKGSVAKRDLAKDEKMKYNSFLTIYANVITKIDIQLVMNFEIQQPVLEIKIFRWYANFFVKVVIYLEIFKILLQEKV